MIVCEKADLIARENQLTTRAEICRIDSSDSVAFRKISISQQVMTHPKAATQMSRNSPHSNPNNGKKSYLSGRSLTLPLTPLYVANGAIVTAVTLITEAKMKIGPNPIRYCHIT